MTRATLAASWRSVRLLVRELLATSPRESVGTAVGVLLLTVSEGAGLLLLAPLLELIGVVEESPLPRAGGWLRTLFATIHVEPTLASVLLLFVAVAVVRTSLLRVHVRLAATLRENLTVSFRARLYRAMADAEWRFLVTRKPSEFMHTMLNETGRIGVAASHLIDLAVAAGVALMYLAMSVRLSPSIAILVLMCAAVLGWLVRGGLDRSRAVGVASAARRTRLNATIAEEVAALKVAKSYGLTDRHVEQVAALAAESRHFTLEMSASEADVHRTLELGSTILLAIIVYASSELLNEPANLLLVMLFIFARLMPRLIAVYRHAQALIANLPVFEAVRELERECLAAAEPARTGGSPALLESALRLDGVSFTYLQRTTPAVDCLDLEIRAGDTTAIIGASGSGKSTVADLLLGLLTPDAGRILLDGRPLLPDQLDSWRSQLGYVSQDTFLFDDTVRANLRWARPEASDDELWAALRMAAADGFVAAMPQSIDTVVGDRGVRLSGGERQRLSIARALLRRPHVLVLDEATSALDRDNESRIQEAIDALHGRMTIILITHRLSTIRNADRIHVMESGRVIATGTWTSLGLGDPAIARP